MNTNTNTQKAATFLLTIDPNATEPYLKAGFTPIPLHTWHSKSKIGGKVRNDGKRPRDKDWTNRHYDAQAVMDECVANNWNVGIRLGPDDLVVDVDPRNGGDVSFEGFCEKLGLDPADWPRCLTGGGGDHFFLKKPPTLRVRLSLPDYPGLEFKTDGQQVVAAGSVHPDTKKRYRWAPDHPPLFATPDAPAELLEAIRRPDPTGEPAQGGEYEPEQIAVMLARLKPEDFQDHDKWRGLMMSVHHASAGTAREEFIRWSTLDPTYANEAEIIGTRWDSLDTSKEGAVTFGTLLHHLHEVGAADAIPPRTNPGADFDGVDVEDDSWMEGQAPSEITPVEARGLTVKGNSSKAEDTFINAVYAVVASGIDPALDVLSQKVVFRNPMWDSSYGDTFNVHLLRVARVLLSNKFQGNAYEPGEKNTYDAIMTVAFRNQFNPVLDYLARLTWDGVPRLDRLFVDYFPCGDDTYTRAVGGCFGIAAVRRQRQPGCKFDTMPIMLGSQGWGKSTGIQALCGAKWFSDADMGNLKDKDAAMKLRGAWIYEFAELDSLNRADTASLKAFLSRGTDRQRDPYERIVEEFPRRCVFLGSGNEEGALKDSTGARRYWPLKLKDRVDVARITTDRDQLWAEAATREAAGDSLVLPEALWPVAAERQEDQTTEDPWADALRGFLAERARLWVEGEFETFTDPEDEPRPPDRVHTSELLRALNISTERQTKGQSQRVRTIMVSVLGWKHKDNIRVLDVQGKGYLREG
jgi:hypothetical protein